MQTLMRPRNPRTDRLPSPRARRFAVELVLVVAVSLALGGLTSGAQTVLPDALAPIANSSFGWTALTALIVFACRERAVPSAVFGAASFVALVLGYQLVSTLRGFPTSEQMFLIVGAVVGPFVGTAASWLHRSDLRAALGAGLLAGIALGEAAYGLVVVSATTGWFTWALFAVVGIALLLTVLTRRLRRSRDRVVAVAAAATVAVAFFGAYQAAGSVSF